MFFNNHYMQLALKGAGAAKGYSEIPVSAVLVCRNKVISTSSSNVVERDAQPHLHAEMIVLSEAHKIKKNKYLTDCDLYVTLEPCPMCMAAISYSRIRRLYFSAYNHKQSGMAILPHLNYIPDIYPGIMHKQGAKIISEFFKNIRNKANK